MERNDFPEISSTILREAGSGKYPSHQLRQNREKSIIPVMKNLAGKTMQSPKEINYVFENFTANYTLLTKNPIR